jgi:Tol biopolymer transport system component
VRAARWALLAVVFSSASARGADPEQRWRTIETEHFQIHYYTLPDGRSEEPLAQRLAVVAEDARRRLTPFLGSGLRRKTHVVLTDDTDDYNGSAGVYPYPTINLYATSPDDRAELNDYDDWLSGLFLHEYTHILHVGTIGGACATVVNWLLGWGLGIVYAPNQTQPRWILEGLAVLEESERTSGGRLRNAIWDMYLRAATLEGKLQRLDQFTGLAPVQWPHVNSPYLYGSALMRYVVAHYGNEALLQMSREYGAGCVPGAINRVIRHATGHTWMELYDGFRAEMANRYGAQRDAISRRGETPTRRLTGHRDGVGRPVFTPDGRALLFTDDDGYQRQRIVRLDLATGRARTELRVDGAGGPTLTADGRTLMFHAADVWRTNYLFNDVYAWDRDGGGAPRRLTYGLRATNPGVSPDGARVAFEVNKAGSRGIGLYDMASGRVEMVVPARDLEHAYTPVFSPDGGTLAFSWWRTGGYRDIWTLDLASRRLERITWDRALDLEPRFSPDGKTIYFVSDRTGVYNLYAYDRETRKLYQATNVVNGVFDPAISPDGKQVAFVGFTADGYDVELAPLDRTRWWEADPPLLDRPDSESPSPSPAPLPSRAYNPLPTLLPFVFRPYAAPDGYGELIGLTLSGTDLSARHSWQLRLAFGTGRADDVNFSFNYSYAGLWPSMNLGVSHSLAQRGGLVVDGAARNYDEDAWSFGTGVDLPLVRRLIISSDLSLSYSLTYTRNLSGVPPVDPSATLTARPETGRIAGFGLTWSFQNLRRYRFSISPEEGRYLALSVGIGAKVIGSQYDVYAASWQWNELIPMPWRPTWLRSHVLSLNYSGGISGGDLRHRGYYYLGGYPPQDLLRSIYDFTRPGGAALRGYDYASVVGDQFHVFNFEYRFPVAWIERGIETLPLYLRRLHAKVFVDYGGAFTGSAALDKLKLGVGGEAILEVIYAWYYAAALQLGYAHGFSAGGGDQVYFLLNSPF